MPTEDEGGSAETPQMQTTPTAPVLDFTSNFPVSNPMKVSGNRVTNWEFFRQQDYELGTGLEHRPEPVRLAISMTRSRTR